MSTAPADTSHLETIDYKPPASSASAANSNMMEDEKKLDVDDRDNDGEDADVDLYDEEAEWDEGGKSHCGYSEAVHSTLMSVGESVHKMVGEPTPRVEKELKAVGNWFQEASYAARDLFGTSNSGMKEDAMDAVKTVLRGGSNVNDKSGEESGDHTAAGGSTMSMDNMENAAYTPVQATD
ncbi:expressed unknown protein [Seminavis robusta]|uniref:Uncharacterized protein n=1 Tax=Seminavis robusta TaxID=568900 RepID=A0A9N8D9I0_9STRA|nr:expressed unknown protein [Seminavis robusta]|eukprot:Sro52_g031000.1 n/a (180) ;mRNA; f:70832-71371